MSTSTNTPSRLPRDTHLDELADRLWESVTAKDEHAATEVVMGALDEGVDPESVLLDVIASVQGKVGEEWAAARISVAQDTPAQPSTNAWSRRSPRTPPRAGPRTGAGSR